MAINFPNNPTVGQIYSFGGYSWQWNGSYWESYSTTVEYLPLSGGTVTGGTIFQSGLTANTISATTYFNLPVSGLTEGNGISITNNGIGNFTITSTATTSNVVQGITGITGTSGVSASTTDFGTTIINTAPDQIVTISGGTGITTGGTYPNFSITNTDPDQTVTITGGTNIEIVSNYPNFGINFTGTTTGGTATGDYLPLSGGTVTGNTIFQSGLTAYTISATTYENLPSFNYAQIDTITQFSAGTNNYINFSGINITITSAATNTLVFSAATGGGGGGGVTSISAGSGLSGNTTTGAVTIVNTQVQGITGITAGYGLSSNTTNNVTTIIQVFDYGKAYTTGNNLNFL